MADTIVSVVAVEARNDLLSKLPGTTSFVVPTSIGLSIGRLKSAFTILSFSFEQEEREDVVWMPRCLILAFVEMLKLNAAGHSSTRSLIARNILFIILHSNGIYVLLVI